MPRRSFGRSHGETADGCVLSLILAANKRFIVGKTGCGKTEPSGSIIAELSSVAGSRSKTDSARSAGATVTKGDLRASTEHLVQQSLRRRIISLLQFARRAIPDSQASVCANGCQQIGSRNERDRAYGLRMGQPLLSYCSRLGIPHAQSPVIRAGDNSIAFRRNDNCGHSRRPDCLQFSPRGDIPGAQRLAPCVGSSNARHARQPFSIWRNGDAGGVF